MEIGGYGQRFNFKRGFKSFKSFIEQFFEKPKFLYNKVKKYKMVSHQHIILTENY